MSAGGAEGLMRCSLPRPPFLREDSSSDEDGCEVLWTGRAYHFVDGTIVLGLHTEEQELDATRSQFAELAHMCIAIYAYLWLDATKNARHPRMLRECQRAFSPWFRRLSVLRHSWLAQQPEPHAPAIERISKVLHGDHDICDRAMLRCFLSEYLRERQLPEGTTPRLLQLHLAVLEEYFTFLDSQIGRCPDFHRCIRVVANSGEEGAPRALVGCALLGNYGHGPKSTAMMQGVIACPFYASFLHDDMRGRTAAPFAGIGDSILLHLWKAYHHASPPFGALRVAPLVNAPSWRARVIALPFARDWEGRRYGCLPQLVCATITVDTHSGLVALRLRASK